MYRYNISTGIILLGITLQHSKSMKRKLQKILGIKAFNH